MSLTLRQRNALRAALRTANEPREKRCATCKRPMRSYAVYPDCRVCRDRKKWRAQWNAESPIGRIVGEALAKLIVGRGR